MSINYKLPPGYVIKELPTEAFNLIYPKLAKKLFNDVAMFYDYDMANTKKEIEGFQKLSREFNTHKPFRLNLALYYKNKFVGWAWGFQETSQVFYMCNSAILEPHRRKNLYSCLMKETLKRVTALGIERIFSRHAMTNNAILISKLKQGFKMTGVELNDKFGTMVVLSYYPQKIKNDILDFRSGFKKPDKKMKKIFKI